MNHRASVNIKSLLTVLACVAVLLVLWRLIAGPPVNNWPIVNEYPSGSAIIAFGDSLTVGVGVDEALNYPSRLSAMIGRDIVNAGVNGHTTRDGLNRLERDVLSQDPRVVLLCLGGNDMLRRQPKDHQFENLRTMIGEIQETGALVVLLGIDGIALLGGGYDDDYRELARDTGCVFVPNIMDGVLGKSGKMLPDRIHPNDAGYADIADKVYRYAGDYITR